MSSAEYWQKREAEALRRYAKGEKAYAVELNRIYQDMLDACQREIDRFYGKYAADEHISIAEAKRRVSKADIAEFERKAAKYVRERNFSDQANAEMRLYNAMMKINRLEMLKANIGLELISGHEEMEKFMSGILRNRTEEELQRQAGILGRTVRDNAQQADRIVNASFHNAKFSDRVWMYQDALRADLGKLLQSGMIQGKNPRQLARELQRTFNASRHNAERLMRTELARVQTDAQRESFKRNGFSMYEFIANSGCCDVCSALDGKHFKVNKMQVGLNAPPMHPNCRCSTAAWEDDEEYDAWLDYLSKGGTTAEWKKKSGKAIDNSANGDIIKERAFSLVSLQFFANKSIAKQTANQLQKSIASWERNVEEHRAKILDPAQYDSGWGEKSEAHRKGLLRHWEREIQNFQKNIEEATAEIERRRIEDE